MLRSLLASVLAPVLLLPATAAAQGIDTLALRGHTFFLAHDLLEGRGTGSAGEHLAALYLVSQLQRMGVAAADPGGNYLQRVPLKRATPDPQSTRVTIQRSGGEDHFRLNSDFTWNRGGRGAFRAFAGQALFVGTAAAAAAVDPAALAGRVVIVLGTLGPDTRALPAEWLRHGAVGAILLLTDERQFRDFAAHQPAGHTFIDAAVEEPVWQLDLPVLIGGPALARALLGDLQQPELRALDSGPPFTARPLERNVQVEARFTIQEVEANNVAGLIRGRDPALRGEFIAYTAHYDHLGIGPPDASGDSIYNGFSDNAAGAAMLLAIAESLALSPPARSVLFLFFTGEELGLLGSTFYAAEPLLPLQQLVGVINLDAGAPPAPPVRWRFAGGDVSTLGETASRLAAERGWTADISPASANSDHWPFLSRGIPSVFIVPGPEWEGFTAAERERLFARWDRYHQAGDHWAADFPFRGVQRYAELALALGQAIANEPTPPRWVRN
jgi:hypothetical protein